MGLYKGSVTTRSQFHWATGSHIPAVSNCTAPWLLQAVLLVVKMQLSNTSDGKTLILAGRIFDSYSKQFVKNQLITTCSRRGIIIDICTISPEEQNSLLDSGGGNLIDLRHQTVLPGFVDTHVHCEHAQFS